jgi:menaquinone-dependent protoporphyrinogen oxidase
MENQVLVTYASKRGATAEIAERIGAVLRQADLPTEVLPVKQVRDLTAYRAVIVGSAVYIGQWRKEAVKFLQANEKLLTERPVWLFSSGPTGEGDPVTLLQGWRIPKALEPIIVVIQPRDMAVFHGALFVGKINPIEKWMIKNVKSPTGDFRDWDTITAWATSIANVLKEKE